MPRPQVHPLDLAAGRRERLRVGGEGVDGARELLSRRAEPYRQDEFMQHFAGARTEDSAAYQPPRLVCEHFDEALAFAGSQEAVARLDIAPTDAYLQASLLRLGLGHA